MKTIIIDGGPRKEWNTYMILKEAERGAAERGDEVEYIRLYDLKYSGCRSCLACKRADIQDPCRCYFKDELTPVLEKVRGADRLILGSPIYYGEPTGMLRSFFERIVFPSMSYSTYKSTFKGKVDTEVFLTMNVPADTYEKAYEDKMQKYFSPLGFLNGGIRIHPVCDTLQVEDYSKYDMSNFSEEHKREMRANAFPKDLEKAYLIGRKEL